MTTTDKVSTYFDRKAASFDAIYSGKKGILSVWWDKLTRQNIYSRFDFTLNALSPIDGKKILDAGCGSGRYCISLALKGAKEIVGIDVSSQMIEMSKQLAEQQGVSPQCHFFQKDIMDVYGTFDDTIAIGFFDYIQHPEPVLSHLCSLTEGKLVASFPAVWGLRAPFRKLWLASHNCPVRFYTKSEISEIILRAGFVCTKLIRRGPIYLLIAEPDLNFKS